MLTNYHADDYGVVHQTNSQPFVYDKQYVSQSYAQMDHKLQAMSHLRMGFVLGAMGSNPNTVLDVGYGRGDFLQVCGHLNIECYGCDLFDDLRPDHVTFVTDCTADPYDLITFFDSLEHFPDISFVKNLKARFVTISVPWCHDPFNDEWFSNWKHRKPNEHLHHFNQISLQKFMQGNGFQLITYSNLEDCIRVASDTSRPNILTALFKKIDI